MRAAALAGLLLLVAVGASVGRASTRYELVTTDLVGEISADGSNVGVNVLTGINCDAISVWNPVTGVRRTVKRTGYCDDEGESSDLALAGTRVLWQDGFSANTYSDYEVYTADVRVSRRPAPLFSYEYTHDDYANQYYGPVAGPFAGHGSLLVMATDVEHVSGPDTCSRLWRIDGRSKTLIRRGLDLTSLSVDGGRIAGAIRAGTVVLLDAHGHTLRTFRPSLKTTRVVVLQANELVAAGGGRIVVFDSRSGRVKTSRALPLHTSFQDYANGLAALVHNDSIHVFRVSDGKDALVARTGGKGLESAYISAQLEPAGLSYTYSNDAHGHVVFVPWSELQQKLR